MSTSKKLIGLASYNILDNHDYRIRFQYVPAYLENHSSDEDGCDGEGLFLMDKTQSGCQVKEQSDYVVRQMSTFYLEKDVNVDKIDSINDD